jgi:hypothetical protein
MPGPCTRVPPAAVQTWCRGKKKWESECLCLDCHMFSWRDYSDPDYKTPEEYEKDRWTVSNTLRNRSRIRWFLSFIPSQ